MSTLFLCGAGNPSGVRLAINVNNAEKKWDNIVILDDDPKRKSTTILGCEIVGGLSELSFANKQTDAVVNLIAGSTQSRWKVKHIIAQHALPFAKIIHPNVDTLGVSIEHSDITVYENATLGANATLKEGSIVFMNAVLGHGATMNAGSILGPGAVLNARVQLGERAYFGTNASILPDLTIGENATIAANSSVVNNVPSNDTFIGVPAQSLQDIGLNDAPASNQRSHMQANDFRKALTTLWKTVLGNNDIGPNDNFFNVGGSSRKAFELASAIKRDIQITITPIDIFRYPTIASFSKSFSEEGSPHFTKAKQRGKSRALARSRAQHPSRGQNT